MTSALAHTGRRRISDLAKTVGKPVKIHSDYFKDCRQKNPGKVPLFRNARKQVGSDWPARYGSSVTKLLALCCTWPTTSIMSTKSYVALVIRIVSVILTEVFQQVLNLMWVPGEGREN
jgi:hypothetical protein